MNELTKMTKGYLYDANDAELVKARKACKDLLFAYNQIPPGKTKQRNELLRKLIHAQGQFLIESSFQCDYGFQITVGKDFYANHNCVMLDCAPITIGDRVLLGPNVSLFTAAHPIYPDLRSQGLEYALPITIGNDVWIGGNTVINPGVHIGDGAVIGSGSVVNKDIPANHVAVGNPIRILRAISENDRQRDLKRLLAE